MLVWHLDHSDKIEGYRKYEAQTGVPADDVLSAPRLLTWAAIVDGYEMLIPDMRVKFAWDAFHDLSGDRQAGLGGVGGIPYAAKLGWLDEHDVFDPDDREEILDLIGCLDEVYRSHGKKGKRDDGG